MTSVEELYARMTTDFAARTGISVVDSCDLAARMYAVAAQVYALQVQSDWVRRQCFPQTAQGENLDHHAQLRAIERKQATRARGTVRFYVQTAGETARTIPAGTVCMTAGLIRFETVEDAVVQPGELWADAPVQALEAGRAGNVSGSAITEMAVAPVGISSCTNPSPCIGGVDGEDDESLRRRVLDTFRTLPNGGNAAYYRQLALADGEAAAAVVVPRPRGVGSVDVVVSGQDGVPEQELLERLRRVMEAQREIAVDLRVLAPQTVAVDIAVQVAVRGGYDKDDVLGEVEEKLISLFDGKMLGRGVLLAQLGSVIYSCEGVENYRITTPAQDVDMGVTQLPVLDVLTVEEMA